MSGRQSKKSGQIGEHIAEHVLKQIGVRMVEKINTPWTVLWSKSGRPIKAFVTNKVHGDFIGIWKDTGRKVLVEVKKRDEKLSFSDFEDHQIEALNENLVLGAMSLVVWVHKWGVSVYDWSRLALKKGNPIKPDYMIGAIYQEKI